MATTLPEVKASDPWGVETTHRRSGGPLRGHQPLPKSNDFAPGENVAKAKLVPDEEQDTKPKRKAAIALDAIRAHADPP